MLENRSVPPNEVLPHFAYRDVADAVTWLTKTFGFIEHYRYGDPISGAQMYLGNAWIMLHAAKAGIASTMQLGSAPTLTVFIDDVNEHFQRAKLAGAKMVEDLNETVYGELQYKAEDLEGHHWLFSQHVRDVAPEEWGARVSKSESRIALLPRPRLCYLEIPATVLGESASFYESVFRWNIRHRDSERPAFDDATGNVSGAWVTGRSPAREAGLLPYIWVDNIDVTLTRVNAHGGKVIDSPHPDEPGSNCSIATFRDLAGNLIGLYQEGVNQPTAG